MISEKFNFVEKLYEDLLTIDVIIERMLDNSTIGKKTYENDPNSSIQFGFLGSPYYWKKKDEKNQIQAKQLYEAFYFQFKPLLKYAGSNTKQKLDKANEKIKKIINQEEAPISIEKAKKSIKKQLGNFNNFLQLLNDKQSVIVIVPDTNAIINYPDPIVYKNDINNSFDYIVLPTVLSELDKHKLNHKNEGFRKKVSSIIKRLKGYRKQGNVLKGVTIHKSITVKMIATEPNFEVLPSWLDQDNNDDRIIASILLLQIENPTNIYIFVTSDLNCQNKAQMASIDVFDTDDLL